MKLEGVIKRKEKLMREVGNRESSRIYVMGKQKGANRVRERTSNRRWEGPRRLGDG